MATKNLVLIDAPQIRFAHGSFNATDPGTDHSTATPTAVVITLGALANGSIWQSVKGALPNPQARAWKVWIAVDYTGEVPVVGQSVDLAWAPSTSATQANGNVAGNSGADAVAGDGGLGSITETEFFNICQFIGSFRLHNGAVVQNGPVAVFSPLSAWGQMVVRNAGGAPFEASELQMAIWMEPLSDEFQDA